ncbi:MAG: Formate dehydrogenase, nitrate-inducible, iron-sulfur subunit [Calditrichaeota bacterium]|nr:Formate dehydrogenase, nitrate-inducible, iron-sulfur subunit [Calditrichota bacterium]
MSAAILTDVTKCIGCRKCVAACADEFGHEADYPRRWSRRDGLSADSWTAIVETPERAFVRKQCRHCHEPACVEACPVGALHKSASGAVIYDAGRCLGCRYCMMACPYGIPRYDWDRPVPYVQKCILCRPRIERGEPPACTEACPVEATIFGGRDELLAEAHRRIAAEPSRYIDHVWGEHEVGGTNVLYISHVDLSFLAYGRPLDEAPLPERTRPAMEAVLPTFGAMVATMGGLSWIINRRMDRSRDGDRPPADRSAGDTREEVDG